MSLLLHWFWHKRETLLPSDNSGGRRCATVSFSPQGFQDCCWIDRCCSCFHKGSILLEVCLCYCHMCVFVYRTMGLFVFGEKQETTVFVVDVNILCRLLKDKIRAWMLVLTLTLSLLLTWRASRSNLLTTVCLHSVRCAISHLSYLQFNELFKALQHICSFHAFACWL